MPVSFLFISTSAKKLLKFKFICGCLNKICSHYNIAEILLKLALNTNQSINQYKFISIKIRQTCLEMKFGFLNNKL